MLNISKSPEERRGRPILQPKYRRAGGSRVVEVKCDRCSLAYLDYRARVEKAKRHYCGVECQRADRIGRANPKWRGGRIERKCEVCSAIFTVRAGTPPHQGRFCSLRCRGKSPVSRIYADDLEMGRVLKRRRDARLRAAKALLGHHTEKEWLALLAMCDGKCAHCGTTESITRDHITPLSKGGSDLIGNIQPLCGPCNSRKGAKVVNAPQP